MFGLHVEHDAEHFEYDALLLTCEFVQSTKAVQAARRGGPPPESLTWNMRTPTVSESSMNRTQDETRRDEPHDHTGGQDLVDDAYDGATERLEGDSGHRSESISPIEFRGSSDDDGDSRSSSSSECALQVLYAGLRFMDCIDL